MLTPIHDAKTQDHWLDSYVASLQNVKNKNMYINFSRVGPKDWGQMAKAEVLILN